MIRVLICDDQTVVREGLAAILSAADQIDVVALAPNGQEAVAMTAQYGPDLVLMDLKMPLMNGVQATRQIRERHPEVPVLVLTTYATDEWLFDAIRAGAAGYLLKDTRPADLIRAIEGTVAGQSHLDPLVAGKVMGYIATSRSAPTPKFDLTQTLSAREREVLILLAHGLSNPAIGRKLHLSAGTVRNYVSEIFNKLGVSDRVQAAVIAVRAGILDNT